MARPELRDVREGEFAYSQTFDRDGLFGRAYSSSYVVHGIADHAAFDGALGALSGGTRGTGTSSSPTAPWPPASASPNCSFHRISRDFGPFRAQLAHGWVAGACGELLLDQSRLGDAKENYDHLGLVLGR
jgi:hypothetical protein